MYIINILTFMYGKFESDHFAVFHGFRKLSMRAVQIRCVSILDERPPSYGS